MTSTSTNRRQGVNAGAALKVPVRVATTANITLSGLPQVIDGVTVVEDDRVLVKNQTTATENGIYVADTSSWERALDFDGVFDAVEGTLVQVNQGTINGSSMWRVANEGTITIDETELEFEEALVSDGGSVIVTQAGSGATNESVESMLRLMIWPEQFGAVRDGTTDDYAAITSAISRATALGGGRVNLAAGVYACASSITLPNEVELVGQGKNSSILKFTGATNGITVTDSTLLSARISDLQIQAGHANCLNAIYFNTKTNAATACLIQNVEVSRSAVGARWDYGLWGTNFQTSEIRSLRINEAADIGIHLEWGCNALNFYNCEVRDTGANRALEITSISGTGGDVLFEIYWYGGTLQGAFAQSLIHSTGCDPKFTGVHLENTDTSPSDGADIIINGTSKNSSFISLQGGSLQTSGTVRALQIFDSEMNTIVLAADCNTANIIGVRCASITDNGSFNNVIGCSDSSGNQTIPNKIVSHAKLAIKRVVPTFSSPITIDCSLGGTFEIVANSGSAFTISNPTNGTDGQRITIRIYNTSGGAMGAITWSSQYKMATWTNPATGFNRSIDFLYDNSNWHQVGATNADIAT